MAYRIAGVDVHKKLLAVVVADVEVDDDFHFERQKVGTTPTDLRGLADQRLWRTVMRRKYQVMRNRVPMRDERPASIDGGSEAGIAADSVASHSSAVFNHL